MKRLRQIASVAIVVGVYFVGGCKPPSSKPGFNDELAKASLRLQTDAKGLKECIFDPTSSTNPREILKDYDSQDNVAKLRNYSSKLKTALKEVKSDIEDLRLPLHSPKAGDVKERYIDYLKAQEEMLDVINDSLAVVADDNNKLTKEHRDKIQKEFGANREKTTAAWESFAKAYREFCESHHFAPR
jgi:hypothetical protein